MFEKIANRFQTAVLVMLVVLLCAVFVLQFGGPQADGCTTGGSSYAARVDGESISPGDYRASFLLGGFDRAQVEEQRRRRLWEAALDGLNNAQYHEEQSYPVVGLPEGCWIEVHGVF